MGYSLYKMQRSEVVVGPHSEENDKFERCKTLKNETASIEDIKKSDEEKWRFISDHPLPLYQGPFSNPIGIKVLGRGGHNNLNVEIEYVP